MTELQTGLLGIALLFVLLTSILLGMLYAAARNLYLAAAAHTAESQLPARAGSTGSRAMKPRSSSWYVG